MKAFSKTSLILCLLLAIPLVGLSRQADFNKPIDVQADSSEFDEKTGIQTLRGNVQITQGSMKINADEIAVSIENGKLAVIKGKGSPIVFEQENEEGKMVTGHCDEIIYEAAQARLVMIGQAKLKQPNQELSGDRIEFDSKTQKVRAEGGTNGRVQIKIQPPPSGQEP